MPKKFPYTMHACALYLLGGKLQTHDSMLSSFLKIENLSSLQLPQFETKSRMSQSIVCKTVSFLFAAFDKSRFPLKEERKYSNNLHR